MFGEFAGAGVEFVDEDFVQSEIGGEGVVVGGIEVDGVSMGSFLACWVYAGAFVLMKGDGGSQGAVFVDGEADDASASVVGHEGMFAFLVDGDVTGAGAFGGLLVEEFELSGLGIQGIGGDCTLFFAFIVADFIDGVDEFAVGVQFKKGGVFLSAQYGRWDDGTGFVAHGVDGNAFFRFVCISSDEDQYRFCAELHGLGDEVCGKEDQVVFHKGYRSRFKFVGGNSGCIIAIGTKLLNHLYGSIH